MGDDLLTATRFEAVRDTLEAWRRDTSRPREGVQALERMAQAGPQPQTFEWPDLNNVSASYEAGASGSATWLSPPARGAAAVEGCGLLSQGRPVVTPSSAESGLARPCSGAMCREALASSELAARSLRDLPMRQ